MFLFDKVWEMFWNTMLMHFIRRGNDGEREKCRTFHIIFMWCVDMIWKDSPKAGKFKNICEMFWRKSVPTLCPQSRRREAQFPVWYHGHRDGHFLSHGHNIIPWGGTITWALGWTLFELGTQNYSLEWYHNMDTGTDTFWAMDTIFFLGVVP